MPTATDARSQGGNINFISVYDLSKLCMDALLWMYSKYDPVSIYLWGGGGISSNWFQ